MRCGGERLDLGTTLLVDVKESDDHVGDLDTRIVDVGLNVDFLTGKTQQPNNPFAEDGIAHWSNGRGFVGIDAGVLNQNFAFGPSGRRSEIGGESRGSFGAIDA